ncbi:L-serine dehydratase [Marssonina coronariae]|uniref:L-serine dehydratase n=1 Tax=Diplocarpon coronariae TaxID=2795749 RepID=A0A218ZGT2_9HELO|nr:L-serine dehydratase [Marssonina coronariae]
MPTRLRPKRPDEDNEPAALPTPTPTPFPFRNSATLSKKVPLN